ncbi:MAG: sugar ABC transporter permease [Ignavibacteriales bacterium]|nr:sugar ABC transporter permease [Ignavibacteriales bacterium]
MKKSVPYLFLFPALGLILFFNFLPMLQIFYYSFLNYSVFSESSWIGTGNYVRLWSDPNFWWTLGNSFLYMLVTPALMTLALMLALAVRRAAGGGIVFRASLFFPVITPIVIVGIIWRWMFTEDTGILNYLLASMHIPPVHWLTSYPMNAFSVMIVTLWRGAGYYMVIFLAGLAAVPKEIEEASILDGATTFQQTRHILIPMLKPTLLFVFVVSASAAMKMFTEIYVLIPGAPISNKALVSYLYQQAFERFDLGYGSAVSVVLFLMTLSFSYVNIRAMETRT